MIEDYMSAKIPLLFGLGVFCVIIVSVCGLLIARRARSPSKK